jgi:uncharacterized RDD family membrane protein YckC
MLPEKKEFMVRGEDGAEYGPAGLEELREWVRENRAGMGSFVRPNEPGTIWEPWQHFPELVALLAEAQAAATMPGASGLTIAPLPRRILAGILDVILSYILAWPILYTVMSLNVPDWGDQIINCYLQPQTPIPQPLLFYLELSQFIFDTVLTLYVAGFLAAHGQTPAKALLGIRVVNRDGGKPTFLRALVRGLIFSLSVYFFGLPLLYVLLNPHRRGFHDYAADTCVVET